MPAYEGGFGEFGSRGVVRAAGVMFFAFVGFDAVSTAAGEARDPQRTVPIGLLATVVTSPTRCPWRSSARAPTSGGSTTR